MEFLLPAYPDIHTTLPFWTNLLNNEGNFTTVTDLSGNQFNFLPFSRMEPFITGRDMPGAKSQPGRQLCTQASFWSALVCKEGCHQHNKSCILPAQTSGACTFSQLSIPFVTKRWDRFCNLSAPSADPAIVLKSFGHRHNSSTGSRNWMVFISVNPSIIIRIRLLYQTSSSTVSAKRKRGLPTTASLNLNAASLRPIMMRTGFNKLWSILSYIFPRTIGLWFTADSGNQKACRSKPIMPSAVPASVLMMWIFICPEVFANALTANHACFFPSPA